MSREQNPLVPAAIPFHGQDILSVLIEGKPYVAMRPIVEALGLDWRSQQRKIAANERHGHMTCPLETSGGVQNMLVMPMARLNGWLFSVNPEKVSPEIAPVVILYQEECFAALHDYWTKGATMCAPTGQLSLDLPGDARPLAPQGAPPSAAQAPVEDSVTLSKDTYISLLEELNGFLRVASELRKPTETGRRGKRLTQYELDEMRRLKASGLTARAISRQMDRGLCTVFSAVAGRL